MPCCWPRKFPEQHIAHYFSRYDAYPEEFSAYLEDDLFTGDFDTYLKEKYGIDLSAPIDWNAPDKGGMTPAQKVLSDAREEAIRTGVLMSRQKDYPLTEDQRAELELFSYLVGYMGISQEAYETMCMSTAVLTNLQESMRDFTSGELSRYLDQQNMLYGMYARLLPG